MSKPVLKVWCLSDGKPGHYNQSKGLLQTLGLGYTLQLEWLDMRLRFRWLRWLMRIMINRGVANQWLVNRHELTLPAGKPDLILSTGGNTSFLNAALASLLGCKNYYLGSLRGLNPERFTLVFTIEPVTGATNNIVMPLAPVPVDHEARRQASEALKKEHQGPLWTMLIGGSTREYRYAEEEWQALAAEMNRLAMAHGIRWLITTSRRTGEKIEQALQQALDADHLAEAVWYAAQPRKVMTAYLGSAERIFCTEDSLSMLTEAVTSGKPVTSLYPASCQPAATYQAAIQRLVEQGWIERSLISSIPESALDVVKQSQQDPHAQLWDLILASLPKMTTG